MSSRSSVLVGLAVGLAVWLTVGLNVVLRVVLGAAFSQPASSPQSCVALPLRQAKARPPRGRGTRLPQRSFGGRGRGPAGGAGRAVIGSSQAAINAPIKRCAAGLLIAAGTGEDLIPRWVEERRKRRPR